MGKPRNQKKEISDYPNRITMIAKVLRWGNSYGIRLAKEDVEKAGLHEGQEVVVDIRVPPGQTVDLSHLPSLDLEGLATRHDEVDWA